MPCATPFHAPSSRTLLSAGRRANSAVSVPVVAGVAALLCAVTASTWAQTTAPSILPMTSPATIPATAPALELSTPAPTTQAAPAPATQAFIGKITASRVYVRSGPGVNYYEIGQLDRGDLVEVVGQKLGWYQISPPVGTFFYMAKDYIQPDATGATGTAVNAAAVNVRAASALHPNSDYAILGSVPKGTKVTLLGTQTIPGTPAKEYYRVAPMPGIAVYIKTELVTAAPAGTAYKAPSLRGAAAPAATPVTPVTTQAATTQTAPEGDVLVVRNPVSATPETMAAETTTAVTPVEPVEPAPTTQRVVVVPPQPSVQFNQDAAQRFATLNGVTQAEFQKPLMQRDLQSLLKDYKALLEQPNLPPSVKRGSEQRIEAIEKILSVQKLAREADLTQDTAFQEQRKAYEQQWQAVDEKIAELEKTGPLLAQGRLQTSSVVRAKYVLVDPATGRVQAYIDPTADIDLSKLLGQYIGVRGVIDEDKTLNIKVIKVKNATVMAAPRVTTQPAK